MRNVFTLAGRNMKVFFRNGSAVFFSFLSVIMTMALYGLFLRSLNVEGQPVEYARMLDTWIVAAVLVIATFTTTLGAYGTLVEDKVLNIESDFIVSPIKPSERILGYLVSTSSIGVLMSLVSLLVGQLYILIYGGAFFSFITFLETLGLILFSVIVNSSIIFFIILFVKNSSVFATVSTIIGTLIGFVIGAYVPMGVLPKVMQTIMIFIPLTHAGVLFRQVLMADSLDIAFEGAPIEKRLETEQMFGSKIFLGNTEIQPWVSVVILISTFVLFFVLSLLVYRYKKPDK
jgi:multidrug/hemolysin transport system permease protein